jgi:hypothetical protein
MTIEITGTWDIETENWDRFVCGGICDADGVFISYDEDAFATALIEKKGTYWAHNGGAFDHLWLASWCARKGVGWRGIPRGASIVAMYVGAVTLRDSRALWPDKLEVVAELGGLPKLKLDLPCKCAEPCGGYCSITRKMPPKIKAIVNAYLERDVTGLHASLLKLAEYAERFGVALRSTVGASAWATALEWCPGLEPLSRDVATYRRIRDAYFGGRTQGFRPVAERGHSRDIGSAYPAALSALTLPVGDALSRAPQNAFARGDAGVFTARVTVPDCHVPPLPVREAERLVYATGRVTGTWTGDELRHAQSRGVTIEAIETGIYWRERSPLLRPFADRIWALREWAKKNDLAFYPWVKWIANSLTGKLAMKPDQETLYYDPNGEVPDTHKRVLGEIGEGVCYTISREQVSPCAWVEHAAHLTAFTRVQLHTKLEEAGQGAIYCDTDCVKAIDDMPIGAGDGLGEWSHEGTFADWECLAPKLYRYTSTGGKHVGKVIVKGKGMSGLTSKGFDDLKKGDAWVIDRGVVGAIRALKDGEPFKRKDLSRRHMGGLVTMGDRDVTPSGVTRAPSRAMW